MARERLGQPKRRTGNPRCRRHSDNDAGAGRSRTLAFAQYRQSEPLRYWEPHDLAAFLASVRGDRLEALWRLTAMTGMRRGEVVGLRWDAVDFENARVSVQRSLISVSYQVMESATKTWRSRVVDLDRATVAALRAHQDRQELERAEWGSDYTDNGLVFCRENGSPLQPDLVSQRFEAIIKREGLRRIRFHDLRHTHATLALRAGVPTKVVTERLGHHSPAFTLKYYAHVVPGMQADAAAQIATLVDTVLAGLSGRLEEPPNCDKIDDPNRALLTPQLTARG